MRPGSPGLFFAYCLHPKIEKNQELLVQELLSELKSAIGAAKSKVDELRGLL
jgi:hypothetical protein